MMNTDVLHFKKDGIIGIQSYCNYLQLNQCNDDYEEKLNKQIPDNYAELKQNKFISSLSEEEHNILNRISQPKIYEVGAKLNTQNVDKCVYFITKGAIKWANTDTVAKTGYFIGNLRTYYDHKVNFVVMEVLKDSWVVEIPIGLLDKEFLELYPERLYQISTYGTIFE